MLSGRGSGLSPVQRSHSDCGFFECDREVSILRGLGPLGLSRHWGEGEFVHRNNAAREQLTSLNERQRG